MRPEMNHEEAWASLGAGALNALPAEEHEALLAHARTCATCGPELAALSDIAAQLGHADSPPEWDDLRRARLRRRLLARFAADAGRVELEPADAETARPAVPSPPARRRSRPVEWFAGTAAVALLTTALLYRIAVR